MDYPPEFEEFADDVRENLVPKIHESVFVMSLYSGEVDVKFALEMGVAMLLDKPILACVMPGVKVPEKLARVVDRWVEVDIKDPTSRERLANEIRDMMADLGLDTPEITKPDQPEEHE